MKNADMPAMPLPLGSETVVDQQGLTKREIFAIAAMQGLCAHSGDYHKFEHLADDAVNYADAVLKMLEVK